MSKSGNRSLENAKRQKQDEFYTQLSDIEKEVAHYWQHFKGKTVLCNCDDPRCSNFFHYFSHKFEDLGLRRLIATCYKNQECDLFSQNDCERAIWLEYLGDKNGNRVPDRHVRSASLPPGARAGILVRILRLVAVVVLPVVIVVGTMNTPFWSYQPPMVWDRPRFGYGWFIPWKGERPLVGARMICPFLNLFLWTLYLMLSVGYRRIRHYLVFIVVMLGLFGLYAKFVGVKTIYRERVVERADGQHASTQPKESLRITGTGGLT